jgi:hypothetical protein
MPVSAISIVAGAVKSDGRPSCAERTVYEAVAVETVARTTPREERCYAKCLPVAVPWVIVVTSDNATDPVSVDLARGPIATRIDALCRGGGIVMAVFR